MVTRLACLEGLFLISVRYDSRASGETIRGGFSPQSVSEAFCLYADRERYKPYEKNHSTALDAAREAERLQVRNLILYHTEEDTLAQRRARYTEEAATVFSGTIHVPDDLEIIELG